MFYAKVIIPNETGLHARPASGLVRLCKSYKSTIQIIHGEHEEKIIDAKSIINLLAGGLKQYTPIYLRIEGEDENEAGPAVVSYIENLTD